MRWPIMNANQFNQQLQKFLQTAIKDGVGKGKLTLPYIIATLREHASKLELIQKKVFDEEQAKAIIAGKN